jgi:hypothetical protein
MHTTLLGMNAADNATRVGVRTIVADCDGCNTPFDTGGCKHSHSYDIHHLGPGTVNNTLHQANTLLVVVSALLSMDLAVHAPAVLRVMIIPIWMLALLAHCS